MCLWSWGTSCCECIAAVFKGRTSAEYESAGLVRGPGTEPQYTETYSVCVRERTGTCRRFACWCVCVCFGADGYSEDIVKPGGGFQGGVWKRSKDVTPQLAQDSPDGLLRLTAFPLCVCVYGEWTSSRHTQDSDTQDGHLAAGPAVYSTGPARPCVPYGENQKTPSRN